MIQAPVKYCDSNFTDGFTYGFDWNVINNIPIRVCFENATRLPSVML